MKTTLLCVLLAIAVAANSLAVIDEDDNVIGVYFDAEATTDCLEAVVPMSQVPCYIILTNPTFSDLYGFEVGFDYGSELLHLGTTIANSEALNMGEDDNLIVGFGSPTYTDEATLLATLNMMYLDPANSPTNLVLRGSYPSSLDGAFPSVLLADGEIISTALHSSAYNYQMNGSCSFDDQSAGWDEVKSLYR